MKLQPFLAIARQRHSTRNYQSQPVPRDAIERCLEAARLAPSACNSQPWAFIVIDDPELRHAVAGAAGGGILPLNHFTRQAPVLIVVTAEPASASARAGAVAKQKPFTLMDAAIATEHICLQAASEGLGTCILGWFDESRVRELLAIPAASRPALLVTLGYAGETAPPPRRRKALHEMCAWNRHPAASDAPLRRGNPLARLLDRWWR